MPYLDTSLVVTILAQETASPQAQSWLAAQDPDDLFISDWTISEVSSALSLKIRTGRINEGHRAAALASFQLLAASSFTVLPVVGSDFIMAARFSDRHLLTLRASDALHLAVAARHSLAVATLDKRMADAAPALGLLLAPLMLSPS